MRKSNYNQLAPQSIMEEYYTPGTEIYEILMQHSRVVSKKALSIAMNLKKKKNIEIDMKFIEEASMLHDIGVFLTDAPNLKCFGKEKYIKHGILGREILEKEGLPRHALVCERHVGVGISKEGIKNEGLPLPLRDMLPETIEEKIICIADNFFSKDGDYMTKEKPISLIKEIYEKISPEHVVRLENLLRELCIE